MIYFIHDPGREAIKIGTAEDPGRRFRALQTANAGKLVLLGVIPGGTTEENRLHRRFRDIRIRGEWFKATPRLLGYINDVAREALAPFFALCELEPRLLDLYKEARAHQSRPRFCANAVWYGYGANRDRGIKPRLLPLVGWCRKDRDPQLCTMEAYDVAYQAIYEALPDCRKGCECQMWSHALIAL